MPSYIRTLEEVFGKGNVHLVVLDPDYDRMGISTYVVVASPQTLDMELFHQNPPSEKGRRRGSPMSCRKTDCSSTSRKASR